MVSFAEKLQRKMEKREKLEIGKRQFRTISAMEGRAYVWVGNVSLPVMISR